MKSKLIILSVIILGGCGSIPKNYTAVNGVFETNNAECKSLVEEIQKKWAKSDSLHCFYYNNNLIDKILSKNHCLIGAGQNELIKLFGEPNINEKNFLRYNISRKCMIGDNIVSDYSLDFIIESTEKTLKAINFIEVQVNY